MSSVYVENFRAASFTFAEQDIMQEIATEGGPEHFVAEPEAFPRNAGLPQQIQGRFPQYIRVWTAEKGSLSSTGTTISVPHLSIWQDSIKKG
jgi:hypothetical protein